MQTRKTLWYYRNTLIHYIDFIPCLQTLFWCSPPIPQILTSPNHTSQILITPFLYWLSLYRNWISLTRITMIFFKTFFRTPMMSGAIPPAVYVRYHDGAVLALYRRHNAETKQLEFLEYFWNFSVHWVFKKPFKISSDKTGMGI